MAPRRDKPGCRRPIANSPSAASATHQFAADAACCAAIVREIPRTSHAGVKPCDVRSRRRGIDHKQPFSEVEMRIEDSGAPFVRGGILRPRERCRSGER